MFDHDLLIKMKPIKYIFYLINQKCTILHAPQFNFIKRTFINVIKKNCKIRNVAVEEIDKNFNEISGLTLVRRCRKVIFIK